MNVLLLQNCALERFGRYLLHLVDSKHDLTVMLAYSGGVLPQAAEFDAFIVGGTPICALDAGNQPFLQHETKYLLDTLASDRPQLGICFGGQLIARLLGGTVNRRANIEIGCYEVSLTDAGRADRLFKGFPERFPVFQWHCDTFTPPQHAKLLASGDDGTPQAFRVGNAVGLQFHLEVSSQEVEQWTRAYGDELELVGKDADTVVQECRSHDEQMDTLAHILLDNFLATND
jgi:GMP synthase-like glutamine amidotransferase